MTAAKNRGLGKGLEALFNDVEINRDEIRSASPGVNKEDAGEIMFIDIHEIRPNENQPRRVFDREKIEELARSIETHGIIQPIMVIERETGYEIVAGERRWRAAQEAKLKKIPCIIRELTPEQNMLVALIENMQREDLNPIEEASAIDKMIRSFGLTQEEVSKSVGKSRPYITNALRLLKLPGAIQEMVEEGKLTGGHARAIAGIKDERLQLETAERAVTGGWSVREVEAYASGEGRQVKKPRPKPRAKNQDVMDLEEELKNVLGTKVQIQLGPKKGKIEIEYYSREELERLIDMLRSL